MVADVSLPASSPADGTGLAPTLPGVSYTDPGVFAAECERIFEREWYYAGRADEIGRPGQLLTRQVGRESVLLVRGRDMQVRAFLNVCRHRGAQLCPAGTGQAGNAIRCPYHNWVYGLDGALITAPNWKAMADLDKSRFGLHPVRAQVWHGLIWVCLDPGAGPLEDSLEPQITYRMGDYAKFERYRLSELVVGGREEYDVAANWKLIYENFQECYHCATIHPELVATIPQFRSPAVSTDGYDTDGYPMAAGLASFSLSGQAALPRLPGLAESDDGRYYGMVVRPNCFLSLVSDQVVVHRFEPLAPGRTRAVCEWLFPPEALADGGGAVADAVALFSRVDQQDFDAAQWCQPNMNSRAYADGGVLVPSEQFIIPRFYAWYHGLMAGAAAGAGVAAGT